MKAIQDTPKYTPITIVLETEEEARMLWHVLNMATRITLGEYCARHDLDTVRFSSLKGICWHVVDKAYPLEKR